MCIIVKQMIRSVSDILLQHRMDTYETDIFLAIHEYFVFCKSTWEIIFANIALRAHGLLLHLTTDLR